ncbi:unnamed protein product, partial [Rotaria sp. Silwood2]
IINLLCYLSYRTLFLVASINDQLSIVNRLTLI